MKASRNVFHCAQIFFKKDHPSTFHVIQLAALGLGLNCSISAGTGVPLSSKDATGELINRFIGFDIFWMILQIGQPTFILPKVSAPFENSSYRHIL